MSTGDRTSVLPNAGHQKNRFFRKLTPKQHICPNTGHQNNTFCQHCTLNNTFFQTLDTKTTIFFQTLDTKTTHSSKHWTPNQQNQKSESKSDKCPASHFSRCNCCVSAVLPLEKGAYPENSHVEFCCNK